MVACTPARGGQLTMEECDLRSAFDLLTEIATHELEEAASVVAEFVAGVKGAPAA